MPALISPWKQCRAPFRCKLDSGPKLLQVSRRRIWRRGRFGSSSTQGIGTVVGLPRGILCRGAAARCLGRRIRHRSWRLHGADAQRRRRTGAARRSPSRSGPDQLRAGNGRNRDLGQGPRDRPAGGFPRRFERGHAVPAPGSRRRRGMPAREPGGRRQLWQRGGIAAALRARSRTGGGGGLHLENRPGDSLRTGTATR